MSIEQLRRNGYKVRVLHKRYEYTPETNHMELKPIHECNIASELFPKGGETTIQITCPEGTEVEGRSICSLNDTYNRKLGNFIALGRALKKLSL